MEAGQVHFLFYRFLRRRVPLAARAEGSFATPGVPVVPILFVAASAFVVVGAVWSNPIRSAIGVVMMAAGVPIYYACRRAAPAADPS